MFLLKLRKLTIVVTCLSIILLKVSTCLAITMPIQFTAPTTYVTSGTSTGIVTADFNGDGYYDLAVAVRGYVQVFLGNGDGTFQPAVSYPGLNSSSTMIRAADFTGDGRPDLALICNTRNLVSVLINNGDGTFQAKVDYASGGDIPYEMVTADLNGDGKIDLSIANEGNIFYCLDGVPCTPPPLDYLNSANVSVLLGNGDGTFQTATKNSINGHADGLTVLDANGDGRLDLAAINSNQKSIYLLYGLGNGLFQSALSSVTYSSQYNNTLRSADLNRDGIPDMIMSDSSSGQVTIYLGIGNGQYTAPAYAAAGTRAEVYDLNNDGIPDLIGIWNGYFNVTLGTGDGTFLPADSYTVGGNLQRVAVADFDRDGLPDLAFANSTTSAIAVLLNRGSKMAAPSSLSFTGVNLSSSTSKIVTITNSIGRSLTISAVDISGLDSAMFSVTPGGPTPCDTLTPTLAPNESCTIQVIFTPTLYSSRSASLVISSDHPVTPVYTINLSGLANASPLKIKWNGAGTGTVTLLPSTTYANGPRTLYYYSIDTVTLQATPGASATFGGWSGCDTVNNNQCTVTMDMPHTVTATFDPFQPIALENTSIRFSTLNSACDSVTDNSSIAAVTGNFTEQLLLSQPVTYRLRGGCDNSFASCSEMSTLIGALTIVAGNVTIENFKISSGALIIKNGKLVANHVTIK